MNSSSEVEKQFRKYEMETGLLQETVVPPEEKEKYDKLLKEGKPLPADIIRHKNEPGYFSGDFYRINKPDLTEIETVKWLLLKQARQIKKLKLTIAFMAAPFGLCLIYIILILVKA